MIECIIPSYKNRYETLYFLQKINDLENIHDIGYQIVTPDGLEIQVFICLCLRKLIRCLKVPLIECISQIFQHVLHILYKNRYETLYFLQKINDLENICGDTGFLRMSAENSYGLKVLLIECISQIFQHVLHILYKNRYETLYFLQKINDLENICRDTGFLRMSAENSYDVSKFL